ncbi:MAG: PIN domain-containing protein [Gallionellales bacterium RIFCSPLOWO2_12_FULL_59_22]|nr:MAG: PIN domain-containing protein [Gallionellales bacterium RIFCSPLOWO2_02_FULL_59_110]OGT04183.1 MAG: PIN domain-containing protein [Gallionellales bacterium RIFCSPLOWO2_02_58_13]OGT12634.1 MAG: PIN domain-containing protein [Gallionellales bacterium RIFCSPLOWO2_12_FULL_59_22]
MILVADASVAVKWFFRARPDEADAQQALQILAAADAEKVQLHQPPHFIAEVAAVLSREKPGDAQADLADLLNMEFQRVESSAIYATACDLAIRLNHHLFDTLYHAVALHEPNATLITADRRYYDKARTIGQITLLGDLRFM